MLCGRKGVPVNEFHSDQLFRKHLTVRGMRGHSFQAVEMALEIISSGSFPLEKLCTHHFNLEQMESALLTVSGSGQAGAIHCVVDPWATST